MESNNGKSLRREIDKWLVRTPDAPISLARLVLNARRCVRVETIQNANSLVIFFFRHDDGFWSVIPPARNRPTMCADICVA
jgi:hypothetical protein